MAQRRMFSLKVVDTDEFLDMGQGSQLLYFHMAMRADDDGFVNSPKKIMRFAGAKDDDMKVLIAKQFIIPFQSGVIVIRHWKENNYIQSDRKHDTIYEEELAQLKEGIGGVYEMDTKCIQDVSIMDTEDRLGKDRLGKVSKTIAKNKFSREVPLIIEKFVELSPSLTYGNKTQRKACEEMISKWGIEETLRMVDQVLQAQMSDKYCPKAVTPLQMWQKIGDFKVYFSGKSKKGLPSINDYD